MAGQISYTDGAGGERISMTYLPANDANNGWDPHDGTPTDAKKFDVNWPGPDNLEKRFIYQIN